MSERAEFFNFDHGSDHPPGSGLAFETSEFQQRVSNIRKRLEHHNLDAMLFTSMHCISYYSGFLYCAFGRPYGCVITKDKVVTVSANIDAGQPGRRGAFDNLVYTDWQRDNYWRAVKHIAGNAKRIGIEGDHLTLAQQQKLKGFFPGVECIDIADETMLQRMVKSPAEIALITEGARVADVGGYAVRDAIREGTREIDVAMAGRDAMELEIAKSFPDAEYRDTWVWFQSGVNTDGAHNPVTARKLQRGDILSLNTFPMISGYYTALERTLFVGEADPASLKIWQANVGAHELGMSLIKPGVSCQQICGEVNRYFEDLNLLQYRTFGYGHSFGVLSHYYGREAGLELREDIDTVLEPGMVISMEPMLTIPASMAGAGGYREHDILVITENGAENITGFPYGPEHNIVG